MTKYFHYPYNEKQLACRINEIHIQNQYRKKYTTQKKNGQETYSQMTIYENLWNGTSDQED